MVDCLDIARASSSIEDVLLNNFLFEDTQCWKINLFIYIPKITEKEKEEYYQEASMKGPGSRLTKDFFTVIGKMKVILIISTTSPNIVLY